MNKLNLILRAITCASLIITGGSTAYNVASPQSAEIVETVPLTSTQDNNPNIITTDNGHGTITVETKPGDDHYIPPSDSTPKTPVASDISAQPSPTPAPTPSYTYPDIYSFEKAYKGVCPTQVPDGASYGKLNPAVTLGYGIEQYRTYYDLDSASVYAWSLIRGGFGGQPIDIFLQRWTDLTTYILRVDASTRVVSWIYKGSAPQPNGPSDSTKLQLDTLANQLNAKIQQLDQAFYVKCGY